jgi:conjugative transfer region protein (TIGR03748 family)
MPSLSFRRVSRGALPATALVIATTCITACATSAPPATLPPSTQVAAPEPAPSPAIPVVRDSRYTLIELVPDDDQRDLMHQVIELTIPATDRATVGDALHYVLRRSGYRLCDARADTTAVLYTLPLPAAHEHLGPIALREALQLLAGSRWTLQVNDETREVCFVPRHENGPAFAASSPASSSFDDPASRREPDPINDPAGEPK